MEQKLGFDSKSVRDFAPSSLADPDRSMKKVDPPIE